MSLNRLKTERNLGTAYAPKQIELKETWEQPMNLNRLKTERNLGTAYEPKQIEN